MEPIPSHMCPIRGIWTSEPVTHLQSVCWMVINSVDTDNM